MMRESKPICSLLITNSPEEYSNKVIQEALNELGSFQIAQGWKPISSLEKTYDLVVLDIAASFDPMNVISSIRGANPKVRIIVVSASQHWKEAKAALRAGAADYLNKAQNKEEILANLRTILGLRSEG